MRRCIPLNIFEVDLLVAALTRRLLYTPWEHGVLGLIHLKLLEVVVVSDAAFPRVLSRALVLVRARLCPLTYHRGLGAGGFGVESHRLERVAACDGLR